MFLKFLLCITLCSKVCLSQASITLLSNDTNSYNSVKQALPVPSPGVPLEIINNKSYINSADSLSMYKKYDEWVPRVINGWPAKLGDVPYQIALKALAHRAKGLYVTFCGATIISANKLLSAAHCFEEKVMSNCNKIMHPGQTSTKLLRSKYAVAGNLQNVAKYYGPDGPNGQWRTMKSVKFPKKYRFPKDDIAVIIVTERFNFNANISSIPMAIRDKDYVGKCLASGYGRIGERPKDLSLILLLAHLTLIPKSMCSRLHREKMNNFICTSSIEADVGKGDSGGPLVCAKTGDPNERGKGVLVGVVSGNLRRKGSFFTRVSSYRKFIAKASSVSMTMYKYNMQSCTAVTVAFIYKCLYHFDVFVLNLFL